LSYSFLCCWSISSIKTVYTNKNKFATKKFDVTRASALWYTRAKRICRLAIIFLWRGNYGNIPCAALSGVFQGNRRPSDRPEKVISVGGSDNNYNSGVFKPSGRVGRCGSKAAERPMRNARKNG
jgi:hypothetical protein